MSMTIKVPFLPKEAIERRANELLNDFGRGRGRIREPPIPVDEILEVHLGLRVDFDDLQKMVGVQDALGALYVQERQVFIDESLDPHEHPEVEGRLRFTEAHEGGHFVLHLPYLEPALGQGVLFSMEAPAASVICRASQRKEPVEWQADYFASCLLMPRKMVLEQWVKRYGSTQPVVYEPRPLSDDGFRRRSRGLEPLTRILRDVFDPSAPLFDNVARQFAPVFAVSGRAMRIRLEELNLLARAPDPEGLFCSW